MAKEIYPLQKIWVKISAASMGRDLLTPQNLSNPSAQGSFKENNPKKQQKQLET